jgi:regulator of RNase E activity RraA
MGEQVITRSDERLEQVNSSSVTDAMGRRYSHRAHILNLVTPTPERRLFGEAVTMQYLPVRADVQNPEQYNFARYFYLAVEEVPAAGKVLVISSAGHHETSVGGGTKLSRLQYLEMAGVLTDGRLRDFHELANYDFVAYCNGKTTRWGGDSVVPMAIQCPVEVSGVTVIPGDYVYADDSGAVIIPAEAVDWVLDEAVRIELGDQTALEQIRREDPAVVRRSGSAEQ